MSTTDASHPLDLVADKEAARSRIREIAAEYADREQPLGWFEAAYKEAGDDPRKLPWGDLEPNRFFKAWAEAKGLRGQGHRALVVGCGLGDDARYLFDLGFQVTAFDISPTAIEWAKRLHKDTAIQFEPADLFQPFQGWLGAFEFVLEIYTIQPLAIELRNRAIDAVASFVAPYGELVVVCRGREEDEAVAELPYPISRTELKRFETDGLSQIEFNEMIDDEDEGVLRFIVHYRRPVTRGE